MTQKKSLLEMPVTPAFKHAMRWLSACSIVILLIVGYFYSIDSTHEANAAVAHSGQEQATAAVPASAAKKLWVCPMHPHIIRDQPGELCPICGMDLVEMVSQGTAPSGHSQGVHVDSATQQRMGVRLATASVLDMSQDIHAYGTVIADESLSFNLSSKLEGVIRKLHVNSVGQHVEEGQALYEIYSAELLKTQFEYVELLNEKNILLIPMSSEDAHTNPDYRMTESEMMEIQMNARRRNLYTEKFQYYDVDQLVDELNTTYKPREVVQIRAPRSGFITKVDIHEGSAIKPMDNLLSFVDTARVWIDVPVFPGQLAWVKNGDTVTVRAPRSNMPDIKARLQFIQPMVDGTTRTVQARLSVDNPGGKLLIGSFLDVIIHANPHKALAVPRSAVMRTGKGDWVMAAKDQGHFMPTRVETGIENVDSIEITAGLQAGDRVAVNGQFLLDAAASMNDAAQRLQHDDETGKH